MREQKDMLATLSLCNNSTYSALNSGGKTEGKRDEAPFLFLASYEGREKACCEKPGNTTPGPDGPETSTPIQRKVCMGVLYLFIGRHAAEEYRREHRPGNCPFFPVDIECDVDYLTKQGGMGLIISLHDENA